MANLNISENFTIDDIHKIREADYEQIKSMAIDELVEHLNAPAEYARKILGETAACKKQSS